MHDDPLKSLFDEVDVLPSTPSISASEIAQRVRSQHLQRQRRRRILATASLALVSVFIWQRARRRDDAPSPQSLTDASHVAETRAVGLPPELAQLRDRIDREELIVRSLIASERRQQASELAKKLNVRLDGRARVDEQVARASMAILSSADRVRHFADYRSSAEHDYKLVIAEFPHTPWAELAKERIAALQP